MPPPAPPRASSDASSTPSRSPGGAVTPDRFAPTAATLAEDRAGWGRANSEPLLDTPDNAASASPQGRGGSLERTESWWSKFSLAWLPQSSPQADLFPPTGLYTILPMSDARLRPQRTAVWVSASCALVSVLLACVFFMVPRGVIVGTPLFVPHNWHRNRTLGTYTLHLGVHVPVYNANYFPATIRGSFEVLFLDKIAGSNHMPDGMTVKARTHGHELHFCMDASGVPSDYRSTIVHMCMLYPRKLMFVCRADLTATTWLGTTHLPTIDTYFTVDCFDPSGHHDAQLPGSCGEDEAAGGAEPMRLAAGRAAIVEV